MKCMNMGIVYLFYKDFIILEMKVILISSSLSKVASKASENNGLIEADRAVPWPEWGVGQTDDGTTANSRYEDGEADRVFPIWYLLARSDKPILDPNVIFLLRMGFITSTAPKQGISTNPPLSRMGTGHMASV